MKTTLVTSCILLLLISSLLLVDGGALGKIKTSPYLRASKKRPYSMGSLEDLSEFTIKGGFGKRVMQERRYQQFRRNICLSARELDCERQLQDQ